MISFCGFAKVEGNNDLVIVQGFDMQRAFVIFSDGSVGVVPHEKVRLTLIEVQTRFHDLQKYNQEILEEARENKG